MNKIRVLSLTFFLCQIVSANAKAGEMKFDRLAICKYQDKNYAVLKNQDESARSEASYTVLVSNPATPEKLPLTTAGSFNSTNTEMTLPSYWRPEKIPMSACKLSMKQHILEETIREFYIKSYFIYGDPRPIDDLDELIRRGDAIPFKLRILCKSDEFTDDVTLCKEVTIMDTIIPVNPGE